MKYKLLIFIFISFYIELYSQNEIVTKNSIYIFTRSTAMKADYIAKDFNLIDTLSTHIGVGIKKDNEYIIYNVSNEKIIENTALICENLDTFLDVEGLLYYSIWEYKGTSLESENFRKILKNYLKTKIVFDYDFVLQKDNELYCSEFVQQILQQINEKKFYFRPIKKELNQFYKTALKRGIIEYIPVDFFTQIDHFIKIKEVLY